MCVERKKIIVVDDNLENLDRHQKHHERHI